MSLHVLSCSQLWLCMVLIFARVVVDAGISWSAPGVASTVPPLPGAEIPLLHAPTPSSSRTDHAIDAWTSKVQHNAQDDYAWVQLGDAWMQKARETVDASYYGRAEGAFRQALALRPTHVEALTGLAWVYGARHEFEQSIAWARQAVAIDPQHQPVYGLLGDAALELGEYEDAFVHYQKMLDLRPDLSSYSRAAQLLFLTGDTRHAMALMQKAIAAGAPYAENTAWCRAQLALMLWHTGALLPAQQVLQTGLAQMPDNYHLLVAMGKVKASQQEYDAALAYYQRASAIAPQPEAVVAIGDLYALLGQDDAAEKHYALLEVIQHINQANGIRGDVVMARFYADHDRQVSTALAEAEAVYKTRKNIFMADTLAWCYYKNGRYAEARKAIKHALSQKTPDAMIFFHAGMIAAKLEDRPTAQKYLYQALSLNANFHPVYASVAADTLQQLGTTQSPVAPPVQ